MNATKDFMLEASGRAEALQRLPARVAACLCGPDPTPASDLAVPPAGDYLVSAERKLEVSDLCFFFFRGRARTVYALTLSPYLFGGMWAHGVVFANSFAANVPVFFLNGGYTCTMEADPPGGELPSHNGAACLPPFLLWLAVFAALGWPLACCELKEQRNVQMAMFGARVVVVVMLSVTVLAGYGCGGGGTVFVEDVSAKDTVVSTPLFNLAGLPAILPVSIYAFIFHHSTPVISQVVADKTQIPRAFGIAFGITASFYALLGVTLASWFGSAINPQCNLNWKDYVGCVAPHADGSPVTREDQPGWARALSFIVLVFPALDVLSAFPLSAITLGNNLRSAINPKLLEAEVAAGIPKPQPGPLRSVARLLLRLMPPSRRQRMRIITFRLLAAVPPLFVSAISTYAGMNLGQIFRVIGSLGILIALTIPSLLRIQSYARHEAVLRHVVEAVTELQEGSCGRGGGGGSGIVSAAGGEAEAEEAAARGAAIVAAGMAAPLGLMAAIRAPRVAALVATPYTGGAVRLLGRGADVGCLCLSFVLAVGLLLSALL